VGAGFGGGLPGGFDVLVGEQGVNQDGPPYRALTPDLEHVYAARARVVDVVWKVLS
jgi:hypothetical protein